MEDFYIIKKKGNAYIFHYEGCEDDLYVSCLINGAETHLHAVSMERANEFLSYYAEDDTSRFSGVLSDSIIQDELFN